MSAAELIGKLPAAWPRRSLRGRRPSPRHLVVLVAVLALLGGAWLWLRDSSLVAVTRVTVTGVSGSDAAQIEMALNATARNMTTLDVNMEQLRMAVGPYPDVKSLEVSTQFPHGMRIRVIEARPIGAITVGGSTIVVASDGTLLRNASSPGALPQIPLRLPPGGTHVTDPTGRAAVALLTAAPPALLGKIATISSVAGHGLTASLRSGPEIYFGDATELDLKWSAATAVLADPGSVGASYIDVTDPRRPAAGAGSDQAASAASGSISAQTGATGAAGSTTSATTGSATPGG